RSVAGRGVGWVLSLSRGEGIAFLLEDVRREFRWAGERARFRERERGGDFFLDLPLDAGPLLGGKLVRASPPRAARPPWVALRLAGVSKLIIVPGTDMLAPAVRHPLEEPRPAAGAHLREYFVRAPQEAKHVVPVEPFGGHPVGLGPAVDVWLPLSAALVRVDRVAVVLAHEQDRQSLEYREGERLGEHAFFPRPVPEETDDHAAPP